MVLVQLILLVQQLVQEEGSHRHLSATTTSSSTDLLSLLPSFRGSSDSDKYRDNHDDSGPTTPPQKSRTLHPATPAHIPNHTSTSQTVLTESHPVYCFHTTWCCGLWDMKADNWWLHHPDWFVALEDVTGFCFAPLLVLPEAGEQNQSQHRTAMIKRLHWQQWGVNISDIYNHLISHNGTGSNHYPGRNQPQELVDLAKVLVINTTTSTSTVNCSDLVHTPSISSGYGATLQWMYSTFWFAYTRQRPFQMAKRIPWLYFKDLDPKNGTSPSWVGDCPDQDSTCLYLPLSLCPRDHLEPMEKIQRRPDGPIQKREWLWMRDYMTRPLQTLRRALWELRQPYEILLQATQDEPEGGCIALHVRRGDAGVPKQPYRRYAAISEYLQLLEEDNTTLSGGHTTTTRTIFLLTDDQSTIDEVAEYYDKHGTHKYKFVYTHKSRVSGTEKGFNGHIPSGSDGPTELLYIIMEQDLAAKYCRTLVHGVSGYANTLTDKMAVYGTLRKKYFLNTKVEKSQVEKYWTKPNQQREADLMQDVRTAYHQSTTRATTTEQ